MSRSHLPATESSHASRPRGPFFSRPRGRSHGDPPPFFQPKLTINAPGDRFEQEADRVADTVVAGESAPAVQRMCSGCAEESEKVRRQPMEEEEEMIQASADGELRRQPLEEEEEVVQAQLSPDRPPIAVSPLAETVVQREEGEEKDPLTEGLKLTAEKALEKKEVKEGLENLWDDLPGEAQGALISFGGISLGMAYLSLIYSSKMRENLSDVDIGKPLSLIPYVPIESFTYKLPAPGKSGLGLSAELAFTDYFELLREHVPAVPITDLTLGLEGTLRPGGGFSVTGGSFGLEFLGGGIKAEGKTFTELSPYPMTIPGAGPLDMPSTLMQSYPELPGLQTGLGGQITLSADLAKLLPGVFGGGITPKF